MLINLWREKKEKKKAMSNYFDLGIESTLSVNENKTEGNTKEKEAFRRLMKENMESNAIFLIDFTSANKEGDLSVFHDGWNIVMKNAESLNLGNGERTYNPQRRFFKLEQEFHVMVTEIDDETSTIYVSHAQATRMLRAALSKKIREELRAQSRKEKPRKKVILPARIAAINDEEGLLRLDLAGFNIVGVASSRNLHYDRSKYKVLSEAFKVGDEIDIQVYRIGNLKNGMHIFHCGNTMMRESAWKGISKRITKGSIVVVRCNRLTGTGAFIGELEGERVTVLCMYPRFIRDGKEDEIRPGEYYKCTVREIKEEKKSFKCNVLARVDRSKITNKNSGISSAAENAFIADVTHEREIDEPTMKHEVVNKIIKEQKASKEPVTEEQVEKPLENKQEEIVQLDE